MGEVFDKKRQSQEDKRESIETFLITCLCHNDHPDESPDRDILIMLINGHSYNAWAENVHNTKYKYHAWLIII